MTADWARSSLGLPLAAARQWASRTWLYALAALCGASLGVALVLFGAKAPLAAVGGLLLFWVAVTSPESVLLLLLAFGTGLVPAQFNLSISLGVANVYLTDLLLAPLLLVLVARSASRDGLKWRSTALDLPIMGLMVAAVGGMLTAWLGQGIPLPHTTHEARFVLYYFTYFLVTNMVRTRDQLLRLLKGSLVIALLVSASMVAQALGVHLPFAPAYSVRSDLGVIRLFNSGENLVSVSLFVAAICAIVAVSRREAVLLAAACIPMSIAIVVGLSRNALIAGVIAMSVGLVLLRGNRLFRLSGPALIALAGVVVLVWLGGSSSSTFVGQYLTVYSERFARMFSGQLMTDSDTLNFRFREITYAWPHILASPMLGIGFSTPYRPAYHVLDTLTRYIHNAYLWLWLKAGLLGLVAFLWVSGQFMRDALSGWRRMPEPMLQAVVLGGGLALLSGLMSNLVAPSFVQDWGSVVYPLLLGTVECILLGLQSRGAPIVSYEVRA